MKCDELKKLRILHFALGYSPVYGGNTTRIEGVLSDNRHDHSLYVPSSPSIYIPREMSVVPGEEHFGNIHVRRVRMVDWRACSVPVLDYFSYLVYLKKNARLLNRAVKEERFDLVYGHSPLEFALAASIYAKAHRLPLIYEAHSIKYDNLWRSEHPVFRYYHGFMQRFLINKEKLVFKKAQVIVAQTAMSRKRISRLYDIDERKIVVLHNGVDMEKFDPAMYEAAAGQLRRERKWDGKFVIMYTGLLDWTNGISFLLDCIEKFPANLQRAIKVVFIGRGELKERIIEVSRKVKFVEYLGLLSHDKIPLHMAACDLFCIPRPSSLPAETLTPMKLLEAMAMERLVLVSDVGGMTEVVQDGRNGLVFKHNDSRDFIRALQKAVKLSGNSNEMRQTARRDVLANHTWQKAREGLQEAYDRLAGAALP